MIGFFPFFGYFFCALFCFWVSFIRSVIPSLNHYVFPSFVQVCNRLRRLLLTICFCSSFACFVTMNVEELSVFLSLRLPVSQLVFTVLRGCPRKGQRLILNFEIRVHVPYTNSRWTYYCSVIASRWWPLAKAAVKKFKTSQRAMERKMINVKLRCSLRQQRRWPWRMPQCVEGPARIHWVLPSLVCKQARSLLECSAGSDSSAAGVLLSLEMC